ncbi:hypothetical protein COCC4DRAFT_173620, partial [Bipolaris maydis ATCC 48331]|uniref:Uncharacterized protein n=2 Tax=Cochliobolus heterostrophus TaxID=5016 RepID=M2TJQ8_COCH5
MLSDDPQGLLARALDKGCRFIVMQASSYNVLLYRTRLASVLLHAFELQTQHIQVLENTIAFITDIRSLGTALSKSSFDNRIATYNFILDQWLSLVAIYLAFSTAANFHST